MILPIDKNYRLAGTSHAWTIEKSRSKKGKTIWEAVKWYGSLEEAVKALGNLMIQTSDAKTLAEALREVDRVSETLCRALSIKNSVKIKEVS